MIRPNLSIHDGFSCEVAFWGLGVNRSYNLYSEPAVACVSSCVVGFSPQSNRSFRLSILLNTPSPIVPKFFFLFFSRKTRRNEQ